MHGIDNTLLYPLLIETKGVWLSYTVYSYESSLVKEAKY